MSRRPFVVLVVERTGGGGIAQYTHGLCAALQATGVATHLLTAEREPLPDAGERYSLHEGILRLVGRGKVGALIAEVFNALVALLMVVRLRPGALVLQANQCGRADPWLIRATRLLGVRVVWVAHNVVPHEADGLRRYAAVAYRESDRVVTLSEAERLRLADYVPHVADAVTVLPHGALEYLAVETASAGQARRELGLPGDRPILLCFGHIKPYKGVNDLLDAVALLRDRSVDVETVLAGGTPEGAAETIQDRIRELGIEDRTRLLPGYMPVERASTLMTAADVVVLPHRQATQSGVPHLAYAHGRPVVVTDAGGLPEAVDVGETGEVARAGDAGSLADALARVLSPEWRLHEKQVHLARRPPQRFEWERLARSYLDVLGLRDAASAGPDPPIALFLTDVLWDGVWYSKQHLAAALAKDYRVLFAEVPVSVASLVRDPGRIGQFLRRRRVEHDQLAVFAPLGIPPQEHPRLVGPNTLLLDRQVRSTLRSLGWWSSRTGRPEPDVVFAGLSRSWRLRRHFPDALWVAHVTDRLAVQESEAGNGGTTGAGDPASAAGIQNRELLLATADAAITVSEPLVTECEGHGLPTLLVPQGVDADAIGGARGPEPTDLSVVPRPRVGFVGHLTWRIDADRVVRTARARPEWHFVFVGDTHPDFAGDERERLEGVPNIHLLGRKPRHELGRYLAGFDAAWAPYTWTSFNRASNPLKIMEYLAAGLPAVANRFPAVEPLEPFVTLVDEDGDWDAALAAGLEGFAGTTSASADEQEALRQAFARSNSWAARGDALAAFLDERRRTPDL